MFCQNCSIEKEDGHKCYIDVDEKYFNESIMDAFFIRCSLCQTCSGLGAVRKSGQWKRIQNTRNVDFSKGYICPVCASGLHL